MSSLLTLVAILGVIVAYEAVRHVVVKRARAMFRAGAVRFVREHRIQLESARFIDRLWMREAMAQDPRIDAAVARIASDTGQSVFELRQRVDVYVEEIAPFFSLSAYYRFGPALAKRIIDFLFELVFDPSGFEAQRAKVPSDAVRVYVINHRANIDPAVLAYGLLRHVPMSYAVGEWALVWPLHTLFRSFGSYFVRRGEKDPLYHAVLERFVQLLAGQGAVTGFFIEGGLSRDGALRRPRTGLLDYILGLRHDHPNRDIAFMPVGLNYDRVLEDGILIRSQNAQRVEPTWMERLWNLLRVLFWVPRLAVVNMLRVAMRSHRKFGYAALEFGEPLLLSQWEGGSEIHTLPREERQEALRGLAEELLNHRVGSVIPATPVAVLCEALQRVTSESPGALRASVAQVIGQLRAAGAPLALGEAFDDLRRRDAESTMAPAIEDTFDAELRADEEADRVGALARMLLRRRGVLRTVMTPSGRGVRIVSGAEPVVSYYASSIAHHLPPREA
ncbi:MAG: 1-acyl-sn-glycerol-3-phosphate acyltransferase [Myxococcales bacterium]|nr:1-acyl-sn-glycerol-3-phosphate acyltransferase [Myxococcales bacterium]